MVLGDAGRVNNYLMVGLAIVASIGIAGIGAGWFILCDIIEGKTNRHTLSTIIFSAPAWLTAIVLITIGIAKGPDPTIQPEEPMKTFRTDEDRRVAEHLFHRSMKLLIKHYRNGDSIDKDLIYVINTYENLNGKVENEDDEY